MISLDNQEPIETLPYMTLLTQKISDQRLKDEMPIGEFTVSKSSGIK